jgi:hypothetical protein
MFLFKRKTKPKEPDNIFKTISTKRDSECNYLTKMCFQQCVYEKDLSSNITKYCSLQEVFEWETIIYIYLLDKNISPIIHIKGNNLRYDTNDKLSLYQYIKNGCKKEPDNAVSTKLDTVSIKLLLNELFGFVCKFRSFYFLHGNLHVHNIFVNPDTFIRRGRFYVIDFSNSFLLDRIDKSGPKYQRTSFLGEMDHKITSIFFEYWDFFTLYVSLKLLFRGNLSIIVYLDILIRNYIKEDVLQRFLQEYEKYNDTNILTFYFDKPTFVSG